MDFKQFATRTFRLLTAAPSDVYTRISVNRGDFTSKAILILNVPFEQYADYIIERFNQVANGRGQYFESMCDLLSYVRYKNHYNADPYNDNPDFKETRSKKAFFVSTNIAEQCFFYKPKRQLTHSLNSMLMKMEKTKYA